MGLFDWFRAAEPPPPAPRQEPTLFPAEASVESETQWRGLVTASRPSRAGVRVDEKAALSLPATLQALRVLTGVFAMTPLHYYRRSPQGRLHADDEAIHQLLHEQPNSHQSAFAFKELLLADVMLAGKFFAYVSRDMRGRPVALTRLKPDTVLVNEFFDRAEGTMLFFDATLPDGTRERFPARDIWHVPGFTRDGLTGLNPLDYARDALGGAIATADFASRFWANNAQPPVVLKTKHKVDAAVKQRIREDWRARFQGPNGDSIAVVDQEMEPSFLAHDNQKSQYLETRTFQVVDLARIWGVPPHLIFDLSRATFSNIEHQSLEFITYHMGPHYERVASAATRQFAAPGHYFEFLTDALVRGDLKSRMEAYWQQRQMGMVNADELRRRENLPDIGGPAGREYWRPGNMAVAGSPVAPTAPAEPGE